MPESVMEIGNEAFYFLFKFAIDRVTYQCFLESVLTHF